MDLAQKMHFFALDLITDVGFGQPLGDLTDDQDHYNHIKATGETLGGVAFAVATGLMRILLIPSVHRLLISEQDRDGLGKLQG